MAATETSLSDARSDADSPIRRLLVMIGTRGLDQLALGGASLLIARRTGTEDFAPFATIFILYALASQVGDGGLAFAILRMPRSATIASSSRDQRRVASIVLAAFAVVIGYTMGGVAGTVIAVGGFTLVTGPAVYVGRASLQRAGDTQRLSQAEGVAAVAFLASVVVLVHTIDDLLLFGLLCVGKHLVELVLQRSGHRVFSTDGSPVKASGVWFSQIVTYATANVDYLIVGALLGPEALSIYAIGFRLASAFSSVVSAPLTRTAFVDFANTSDAQAQHDRLLKQIAIFGVIGIGATCVVGLVLPVLLGSEWAATRTVTVLLGLALPWRLLLGPVVALGLTSGTARRVIGWELVRMVGLAASIAIASGSLNAVAGAVSAATIVTVTWAYRKATAAAGLAPSTPLQAAAGATAALSLAVIAFV